MHISSSHTQLRPHTGYISLWCIWYLSNRSHLFWGNAEGLPLSLHEFWCWLLCVSLITQIPQLENPWDRMLSKEPEKNYIKLVVIKKMTNNEESEAKNEDTKKASTKEDLGRRWERLWNKYKSSEFNLYKEMYPPQSESLLLKCCSKLFSFLKTQNKTPSLRNIKNTYVYGKSASISIGDKVLLTDTLGHQHHDV